MDPTAGVAVMFGTQLAPPPNLDARSVSIKLEHTLYEGLEIPDKL